MVVLDRHSTQRFRWARSRSCRSLGHQGHGTCILDDLTSGAVLKEPYWHCPHNSTDCWPNCWFLHAIMTSKCSNAHSPVQLNHNFQFLKQRYRFSFLVNLKLFNRESVCTHTHTYVYISSIPDIIQTQGHSTPHTHSSMTINKQGICTTYHEGCHNNSGKNRWNHNTQTHKWDDLLCTGILVIIKYIEILWSWNMQVPEVCNPVQSGMSRNPKLYLNLPFIL